MRVAILSLALLASGTSAANAAQIFSNDFETNANGFTTASDVFIRTAPNGQKFLELRDGGSASTLTLDTSAYIGGTLTVTFDVYAIGSMDGTGPVIQGGGAGDFFNVTSGGATLLSYAFANYDGGNLQTYPTAGSKPTTGASGTNTLGYSGFPDSGNGIQDSTYALSVTLSPTAASTSLMFQSFANEGEANEFYGFDNVVASATPAVPSNVPEPASWALMLAGFGLTGGALRRRRQVAAIA